MLCREGVNGGGLSLSHRLTLGWKEFDSFYRSSCQKSTSFISKCWI